jgi:hypothetical protein
MTKESHHASRSSLNTALGGAIITPGGAAMTEKPHPGISMHKLPVGPGFIGLVFTVGCALIFLFGLPQLWCFVAFSAALGIVLAIVFRLISQNRSERVKPISILQSNEPVKQLSNAQGRQSKLLHAAPILYSA